MKYLYGAAVQGIQNFIFQTNELKDIVGASELVENICTVAFEELFEGELEYDDKCAIVKAAGNIKYIFDSKEDCAKIVREFPKKVMTMAPGITISQAVVELKENVDESFENAVDDLEAKLRKQRNTPNRPQNIGLIGIQRSRRTGQPATNDPSGEHLDLATIKKRMYTSRANEGISTKLFGEGYEGKATTNITKLTGQNDWIAIIHADGNGLGKVVAKIGKDRELFREFSRKLDEATQSAAHKAYDMLSDDLKIGNESIIPIRPIVLGGDDLTVVCRADVALPFVSNFLAFFEAETHRLLNLTLAAGKLEFNYLTACAGIAYIKSSYPFYYGYHLAEALCEEAKKDAKDDAHVENGLAPSCLMFHKVQDSFVESYSQIAARELTPANGVSFAFGPYYFKEMRDRWSISQLVDKCNKLIGLKDNKEGNAVKSHLRQWMSLMHENESYAKQKVKRILDMLGKKSRYYKFVDDVTSGERRKSDGESIACYPVYDILSQVSIANQVTKYKIKSRR